MGRRSIWRSTVFGGAERVQKGGGPDSTGELYSTVGGNQDVRTFTDESEVFRPVFQDETVDDRAGARASDDQQFMDSLYACMGGMGFQRVAAMPPDSRSYDDVGETAQLDDDEFLHGDKFSDSNYSGGVERAGGLSRPFAGYALPVEGETRQRMVRLGNNWIPAGETSRTPNSDFRAARGVSKPFTRRLPDAKTPPARSAVRKSLGGLFRDAIFDRDGGTSTTR